MTIGLVLLAITAILLLFGVGERFLRKIGVKSWAAFILVLALVIGAVIPSIKFGTAFSVSVGGFLVPLILTVILCARQGFNADLTRSLIATVAVTGIAVAVRMLILPGAFYADITTAVIIGFVGGTVAYLIGTSRLSTLTASIGGIVLGDVIVSLILRFVINKTAAVALGAGGVFDSVVMSAIFGIVLLEGIGFVRRAMSRKAVARTALNMETASDDDLTASDVSSLIVEEDYTDYFGDGTD